MTPADRKAAVEWAQDYEARDGVGVESKARAARAILALDAALTRSESVVEAARPLAHLAGLFSYMADDMAEQTFLYAVNGSAWGEEYRLSVADARRAASALAAYDADKGGATVPRS